MPYQVHPVPRKPRPSGRGGMANGPEGFFPEATAVRPWNGVHIAPAAQRGFKRLPPEVVRRVDAAIVDLEQNPRPHGCTKLEGSEHEYRVRVGDYRILYVIDDQAKLVTIAHVRHRREAYHKR